VAGAGVVVTAVGVTADLGVDGGCLVFAEPVFTGAFGVVLGFDVVLGFELMDDFDVVTDFEVFDAGFGAATGVGVAASVVDAFDIVTLFTIATCRLAFAGLATVTIAAAWAPRAEIVIFTDSDASGAGARLPAEGKASAPGVNERLPMAFAVKPTATATMRPAAASRTVLMRARMYESHYDPEGKETVMRAFSAPAAGNRISARVPPSARGASDADPPQRAASAPTIARPRPVPPRPTGRAAPR
jgi:hypothetical protein